MLLALQKLEREHVLELTTIELNGGRPIKVVQGDALFETGLEQVALQGLLFAPLDLIGQQQGQELGVVQLLRSGQRQSFGQGGDELTQLQTLEQTHQIGIHAHGAVSCVMGKRWSKAPPGRAKRPAGNSCTRWSAGGDGCPSCSS